MSHITKATPLRLGRAGGVFFKISQGYPCGNFSDTSSVKPRLAKGSIGRAFTLGGRESPTIKVTFTLLFYARFPFPLSNP